MVATVEVVGIYNNQKDGDVDDLHVELQITDLDLHDSSGGDSDIIYGE